MPELPEVETTRRGIAQHIEGEQVVDVIIRNGKLRHLVSRRLPQGLIGQIIRQVNRRAKYLLLKTDAGTAIWHLGMSGSLSIVEPGKAPMSHDHIDVVFGNNKCLRFNDPRRFGCLLWTCRDVNQHRLMKVLGPEPLGPEFTGEYLFHQSRSRKTIIKNFIMNSHIISGVGNIYASESLFLAGIHPATQSARISLSRYHKLVDSIRQVLQAALACGGSTLRDFNNADGRPGYFQYHFQVYGRSDRPCTHCGKPIKKVIHGGRSTFYCPRCQH